MQFLTFLSAHGDTNVSSQVKMKQKLIFVLPVGAQAYPAKYILTPDSITIGKKYRIGADRTFRKRFISDHSVVKKLFGDEQEPECEALDTPIRKTLLDTGLLQSLYIPINKGGFGSVFTAMVNDRIVACKKIRLCQRNKLSFYRESNALHLQHPNVVSVLAIHKGKRFGLVVMEKGPKINLQQTLLNGNLSDTLKIKYMEEVCRGLQYLHRNSILHLDIKPLNMLVDNSAETLQLCDFGNSMLKDSFGTYKGMGTIRYLAPEIIKNETPSEKSDIYSLGITMWQVLHNKIPFTSDKGDMELLYQIANFDRRPKPVDHPFARQVRGMRIFTDIFKACWDREPTRRPVLTDILFNLELSRSCLHSTGAWKETGLERNG